MTNRRKRRTTAVARTSRHASNVVRPQVGPGHHRKAEDGAKA
jgi:hypothetical protein